MELHALPSGPKTEDMLANAAFFVGLSVGRAPRMKAIGAGFDFERAHHNFYRAVRSRLEARLGWRRRAALVRMFEAYLDRSARGEAPQGEAARNVLARMRAARRECLIDLHDNTGGNPAVLVCIRAGIGLAFGEAASAGAPLTISKDIDRHSFERLAAGSPIGRPRASRELDS